MEHQNWTDILQLFFSKPAIYMKLNDLSKDINERINMKKNVINLF